MKNRQLLNAFSLAFAAFTITPLNAIADDQPFVTNRARQKAPISYEEITQLLIPKIMEIPSVRGVVVDENMPNALRVTHSTNLVVRLDNFYNKMNKVGTDRDFETKKFVATIAEVIGKSNPFKTENLRIVIRTKEALDDFETQTGANGQLNKIVRRPFIGDLEEALVAETKTSIAFMPIGELQSLKLSDADAFNLAEKTFATQFSNIEWVKTKDNLMIAKLDGAFDTSLLAIPSIWQNLEAQNNFPIAVIAPNRALLQIGRADSKEDIEKLSAIAKNEATGPHAISDKVMIWKNDHWEFLQTQD
ncbi:MAG: hypothetical protein J0L55_13465 [Caulobacterales bacterium]|nr:hypothetical protein [Caulobacterales bacterium]